MTETIHDILRRAFDELNESNDKKKILGFADYACCTSCANYESSGEIIDQNKKLKKDGGSDDLIFGGINWHDQETDSVNEGRPNETFLGYTIFDEDGVTPIDDEDNQIRFDKFMNLVKNRLEPYGVKVETPETMARKIIVSKVN